MSRAAEVNAISAVVVRLWVREVAGLFGASTRAVTVGVAVSLGLAAGVGALLALIASSQLSTGIPLELRSAVLRTSFAGAALTAGAIGVVLCLSIPPRTALQNLLDLLPTSRTSARIGQLLPLFAAGLAYSLTLSSTAVFVIVQTSADAVQLAGGVLLCVLLVATMLALSIGVFTIAQSATARWIRLPAQYSATVGGAVALGGVLSFTVPDILASAPVLEPTWGLPELLPTRTFAWAATGIAPWTLAVAAGWMLAAAVLVWLSAKHQVIQARSRQARLLLGTRPLRPTPWWGQVWVETLVAVRNPQFAMAALLLPFTVLGVTALLGVPGAAPLAPPLAAALAVFPFMLAIYSVGRTTPARWVGALAGTGTAVSAFSKPASILLSSGVLTAGVLVALLTIGLVQPVDIPDIAARCAMALAIALAVGTVVPYSEQQPLSIVAGGFILAVAYMLASLGIGLLTQESARAAGTMLTLAVAVAAAGVFALLMRRGLEGGPARV